MMRRTTTLLSAVAVAAFATTVPTVAAPGTAAPREAGGGMASGKVSVQDLHFTTQADAAAHCDKAPITVAADGSFACSVPASSGMAINEKGLPGNKSKPAATPH